MSPTKRALLIFIKNPVAGRVKTRLASEVGDEMALAMYRRLLDHTREVATRVEADRLLFYSDFMEPEDPWTEEFFRKHIQAGDDLGQRMENAFRIALRRHRKAVIIGSDCPGITEELIEKAFTALDRNDLVIGPAQDGGYYLLGMKEMHEFFFREMEWSTAQVLPTTLDRAEANNLQIHLLPEQRDVDFLGDWQSYGWSLPGIGS